MIKRLFYLIVITSLVLCLTMPAFAESECSLEEISTPENEQNCSDPISDSNETGIDITVNSNDVNLPEITLENSPELFQDPQINLENEDQTSVSTDSGPVLPQEDIVYEELESEDSINPLFDNPNLTGDSQLDSELDHSAQNNNSVKPDDPYFTSGGQKYSFYAGAAPADVEPFKFYSGSINPVQFAINYISDNGTIPDDGFLYVETGSYNGGVTIDGLLPNLNLLQGIKWDEVGPVFPTIKGNMLIVNKENGFTLRGLNLTGTFNIVNSSGQFTIEDVKGNIALNGVNSSEQSNTGTRIENTRGGNVSITNSTFNRNNGNGAIINTNGAVTVNGIACSTNDQIGLKVENFNKLTINNASFYNNGEEGLNAYSSRSTILTLDNVNSCLNGFDGLFISVSGSVVAKNIISSDNDRTGAQINNRLSNGTITLNNGTFNNNNDHGLIIYSNRAITLNSVQASGSKTQAGVFLDNSTGSGNVTVTSPASAGAAGANYFLNNNSNGLFIYSNGSVVINNIIASGNLNGTGIYIDNDDGLGNVIINKNIPGWKNKSIDNLAGITIYTRGNLAIYDTESNGNVYDGLYTSQTPKNVTISRTTFNRNNNYGADILCTGNVLLTDVSASHNIKSDLSDGGVGISINNTYGLGNVTIKTSSLNNQEFNGNYLNGLRIFSKGLVSISNVKAIDNNLSGLYIMNSGSSTDKSITITKGEFSGNHEYGLAIFTRGNVSLTNIESNGNQSIGTLINIAEAGNGAVTLKTTSPTLNNQFNDNGAYGLYIYAKGNISISNLAAGNNGKVNPAQGEGVNVDNSSSPGAAYVSILNGTFNANTMNGISISSKGNVSLTNVSASNNRGSSATGVYISNAQGSGNVTIKSSKAGVLNNISGNSSMGIYIYSSGIVSISDVAIANNDSYGLWIVNNENVTKAAPKAVNLTRTSLDNNVYGLYIATIGNVTLNTVTAKNTSNGNGASITAYKTDPAKLTAANVIIKGTLNDFSGNNHYGLSINTRGNVIINNIVADTNSNGNGIIISNVHENGVGNVTITGINRFINSINSNSSCGLNIETNGNVVLKDINAMSNLQEGAEIYLYTPGKVLTITNGSFNNNNTDGLEVYAKGSVNLTNIRAESNGKNGINLSTEGAVNFKGLSAVNNLEVGVSVVNSGPKASNLNITSTPQIYSDFSGNQSTGLVIDTTGNLQINNIKANDNKVGALSVNVRNGNISLANITANNNSGWASVSLNNYFTEASTGNVTISGSNSLSNNSAMGLYVRSNGTISLSGITAQGNGTTGIYAEGLGIDKNLTVQNVNTHLNGALGGGSQHAHGLHLKAAGGTIRLTNVKSSNNNDYNSAAVTPLSTGLFIDNGTGLVYLTNCLFFGNGDSGIRAMRNLSQLIFSKTYYFGNNVKDRVDMPDLRLY